MGKLSRRREDYPHLDDAQFRSLIRGETEEPGTSGGLIPNESKHFTYQCPNCGNALFDASSKFPSGNDVRDHQLITFTALQILTL